MRKKEDTTGKVSRIRPFDSPEVRLVRREVYVESYQEKKAVNVALHGTNSANLIDDGFQLPP